MKFIYYLSLIIVFITGSCKEKVIDIKDVEKNSFYIKGVCERNNFKNNIDSIRILISNYRKISSELNDTSSRCFYYLAKLYDGGSLNMNYFYDSVNQKPSKTELFKLFCDSSIYFANKSIQIDSNFKNAIDGYSFIIMRQFYRPNLHILYSPYIINGEITQSGFNVLTKTEKLLLPSIIDSTIRFKACASYLLLLDLKNKIYKNSSTENSGLFNIASYILEKSKNDSEYIDIVTAFKEKYQNELLEINSRSRNTFTFNLTATKNTNSQTIKPVVTFEDAQLFVSEKIRGNGGAILDGFKYKYEGTLLYMFLVEYSGVECNILISENNLEILKTYCKQDAGDQYYLAKKSAYNSQ